MIKTLSIFFLVLFGLFGQDSKFTLVKSIPSEASNITTDNLQNCYITKGNILEKYSAMGVFIKSYSNKNQGDITSIDTRDPFKILLFYKSFQQIRFVDNMLASSGNAISLEALGYNQVSLACSSHNNGFWIYNRQNFSLIQFDQNLQKIQESGNISQLSGIEVHPNFMIQQNNNVFLNDSAKGILVFDIYGSYNKTLPIRGLLHFQVNNDEIIYLKANKLKSFNMKTLLESEIALPTEEVLDVRTEKEKLYLLKQKSVDIYSVKQ